MSGGWHIAGGVGCLVGCGTLGVAVFCGCCFLGASAGRLCASGGLHIVGGVGCVAGGGLWEWLFSAVVVSWERRLVGCVRVVTGTLGCRWGVWVAVCEWWLAHWGVDGGLGGYV